MNKRLAKQVIYYVIRASGPKASASTSLHGRGQKDRLKAAAAAKKAAQDNPKDRFYVTEMVSGFTSSDLVSYNRYDA